MTATIEQLQAALINLTEQVTKRDSQLDTLTQNLASVSTDLQAVRQQNNALNSQFSAMQQSTREKEIEYQTRIDELRKQVKSKSSARGTGLIDTRQVGKPSTFKSDRSEWQTFSFKLMNFLASVYPHMRASCAWASSCASEIRSLDELEELLVDVPQEHVKEMNRDLYAALASLVEGESLDIVKTVTEGEGFEAWRKLVRNFDPQSAGRRRNSIKSLMNPAQAQFSDLPSSVEKWEKRISEYESRTGSQPFHDDIKASVLIGMCPNKLQDHLYQNSDSY